MRNMLPFMVLGVALASFDAYAQTRGTEPYQQLIFVPAGDSRCTTNGCDIYLPAIPAGKRLVVQHVAGQAVLQAGFAFTGTLRTNGFGQNSVRIQLIPNSQPISGGAHQLVTFSQQVTGYVFAGETPLFQFGSVGAGMINSASVEVSLSGYLETLK